VIWDGFKGESYGEGEEKKMRQRVGVCRDSRKS